MQIGRLTARAVIGGLFIGHGTQKLFGWFGGPGIEGTEQMMGAIEMHPTRHNAIAAGTCEALGGSLLVAGAATPFAGSVLIGTMLTAIRKVHAPKGVWVTQGGWEYNAVLISALFALIDGGPGDVSVDALLGKRAWGPTWALAGLGVGAAASTAAIAMGRRQAPSTGSGPDPQSDVTKAVEDQAPGDPVTAEADQTLGTS